MCNSVKGYLIIVVVVDVQPGLDAETGISHPVEIVRTSGCGLQENGNF
jgi:hypothetical protein